MHNNVLATDQYKKGCNNDFLAVVDQLDDTIAGNADSAHSRMCWGFREWRKCTNEMVKDKCGKNAIKEYENFLGSLVGTLANVVCPKDLFPLNGEECKRLKPTTGTKAKGKLGDNTMTKYLTSLFSFMFVTDKK